MRPVAELATSAPLVPRFPFVTDGCIASIRTASGEGWRPPASRPNSARPCSAATGHRRVVRSIIPKRAAVRPCAAGQGPCRGSLPSSTPGVDFQFSICPLNGDDLNPSRSSTAPGFPPPYPPWATAPSRIDPRHPAPMRLVRSERSSEPRHPRTNTPTQSFRRRAPFQQGRTRPGRPFRLFAFSPKPALGLWSHTPPTASPSMPIGAVGRP